MYKIKSFILKRQKKKGKGRSSISSSRQSDQNRHSIQRANTMPNLSSNLNSTNHNETHQKNIVASTSQDAPSSSIQNEEQQLLDSAQRKAIKVLLGHHAPSRPVPQQLPADLPVPKNLTQISIGQRMHRRSGSYKAAVASAMARGSPQRSPLKKTGKRPIKGSPIARVRRTTVRLSVAENGSKRDVYTQMTLVLNNKECREIFKRFLQTELNAENLLFWEAVSEFEKFQIGDSNRVRKAKEILDNFIRTDAPDCINIFGPMRREIETNLAVPLQTVPVSVFAGAKLHVEEILMESFGRFKTSTLFADLQQVLRESPSFATQFSSGVTENKENRAPMLKIPIKTASTSSSGTIDSPQTTLCKQLMGCRMDIDEEEAEEDEDVEKVETMPAEDDFVGGEVLQLTTSTKDLPKRRRAHGFMAVIKSPILLRDRQHSNRPTLPQHTPLVL